MSVAAVPSGGRTFVMLLLCAAAYLYVFPYFPKLVNPNENVRLYMTAALVENGSYQIDSMRERWGWTNDAALKDKHYFSVKAPGTSLLGVPAYWVYYKWQSAEDAPVDFGMALRLCRITATILPWLLFLGFFHRFLGRYTASPVVRDAAFVAMALGSCLYGYGLLFVSHSTAAACAFGAFMVITSARERVAFTVPSAFLAGLLAAGVTFFEYPGLVASAVLSIYALTAMKHPMHAIGFLIGGLIPTLAVMHFQASAFGSPFTPGHVFLEAPGFRAQHVHGLYGWTGFHPDAAWAQLFDLGFGLLPMTPLLAFAAVGVVHAGFRYDIRLEALFGLLVVSLTYLAICCLDNWRGGWTLGPRYLTITIPFLVWLAVLGLDWLWMHLPRTAEVFALGTAVAGVVVSGLASAYFPHIPEHIVRPLPQLVALLIEHDYAPVNAGNLHDLYGTMSMWPLFGVLALALLYAAWADLSWIHALALVVAAGLIAPQWIVPASAPNPSPNLLRVTEVWNPRGHDRASVLAARMVLNGMSASDRDELARVYRAEGREVEAQRLLAGGGVAPPSP